MEVVFYKCGMYKAQSQSEAHRNGLIMQEWKHKMFPNSSDTD